MAGTIYAIATMDTKGEEIVYVAQQIRSAGTGVTVVDVGTRENPILKPDITRQQVAQRHPRGSEAVFSPGDRGEAVGAMSEALVEFLKGEFAAGKVSGVIGLGGSGGTALISAALRALPIGLPKLLVSTVASGNTAPYVGSSDITMMFSVVDVAGINRVSRQILANAAYAIAGMSTHQAPAGADKPTVGMTMFGVTTPCVTAVRQALEARGMDCLVFHATGTGGQAMEKLVESGLISGVLDITTTEVADEVVGGVFPAGPSRFEVILERGIPYVMSVGALDMVNFGAMASVPAAFQKRRLHVHNANVTLMRTTAEENRQFAQWMAGKINRGRARLILLIPEKGVSMIDAPGQPFYDPQADAALFEELEKRIEQNELRQIRRLPLHVNDPAFAVALVDAYFEMVERGKR